MKIMIYPDKLKKGDIVGITAVSATSNAQKIDLAIDNIMNLGLNVIETDNVRKDEGIVSSNGEQRATELLELYKRQRIYKYWYYYWS